ncbi:MAG: enoyl-CoA hydratase/isomerase family protein [Armatimonadetes bacterium]|nr:enoyl-CoA hydratase/isomerase family protein [Armatimonadota bacterium]
MFKKILYEENENTVLITINRPDTRNAIDGETIEELGSAFFQAEKDPAVRSVIITGSGSKVFASGADVNEFLKLAPLDVLDYAQKGQDLFLQIESMSKPVVAAINGHAAGMGCELALACSLRVIVEGARIGMPELALGIVPGNGGTQRLTRLVGLGKALELLLLGELIDAEKALSIGLVNKVVPRENLLEACKELCGKIAEKSPVAVRLTLKAVYEGIEMPLAAGLKHEVCLAALGFAGGDHLEGVRAFLEKRKAQFKNPDKR